MCISLSVMFKNQNYALPQIAVHRRQPFHQHQLLLLLVQHPFHVAFYASLHLFVSLKIVTKIIIIEIFDHFWMILFISCHTLIYHLRLTSFHTFKSFSYLRVSISLLTSCRSLCSISSFCISLSHDFLSAFLFTDSYFDILKKMKLWKFSVK